MFSLDFACSRCAVGSSEVWVITEHCDRSLVDQLAFRTGQDALARLPTQRLTQKLQANQTDNLSPRPFVGPLSCSADHDKPLPISQLTFQQIAPKLASKAVLPELTVTHVAPREQTLYVNLLSTTTTTTPVLRSLFRDNLGKPVPVPVLFFSRPRSEGWPHHGRTFSIYPCPLSF